MGGQNENRLHGVQVAWKQFDLHYLHTNSIQATTDKM